MAHLLLIALGLGLDRDLDYGLRKFHPLEHYRVTGVGQGVAGRGVLQPGQRDDVSGTGFLDVLAVVCVHLQHPADPLARSLDAVQHLATRRDDPGIDANKSERADEGVAHDFEGQPGKRLVIRAAAHDRSIRADLNAIDRRDIGGGRQVIDHCVEQRLHSLVLERAAA